MKAALFIAAHADGDAASNHRTPLFLQSLRDEGVDVRAFEPTRSSDRPGSPWVPVSDAGRSNAGQPGEARNGDGSGTLWQQFAPDVVHTIGRPTDIGTPWAFAARAGTPVLHHIAGDGSAGFFAGRRLRSASRAVVGLIGSNGVDIARARARGLFVNARFSVIAPPPIAPARRRVLAQSTATASPLFGYFDPQGTAASLAMVIEAAALFGASPCRLCIPASLASLREGRDRREIETVEAASAEDFVERIDVLVVPYSADHFAEVMVRALENGRRVIAPDRGLTAEILDFGRRGDIFDDANPAALAVAMQNVVSSSQQQPIFFEGAEIATITSPRAVARCYVEAYDRALGASGATG